MPYQALKRGTGEFLMPTTATLYIEGCTPALKGNLHIPGSKNSAMPLLTMAALQAQRVTVEQVPNISDITHLLELLAYAGNDGVNRNDQVTFQGLHLKNGTYAFPSAVSSRLRGAIYALALPASQGICARLEHIGGDLIDSRSFAPHLRALTGFGLQVRGEGNGVGITGGHPRPNEFFIDDKGITATSLAIIIAATLDGESIIKEASLETECDDVLATARHFGAIAVRDGRTLIIRGPYQPTDALIRVPADHLVWGTYAIAGAMTGGSTTCDASVIDHRFTPVIDALRSFGISVVQQGQWLKTSGRPTRPVTLETGMYPNFPSDLLPQMMVLAVSAPGTSVFRESHYGSRFDHLPGMKKMGVQITMVEGDVHIHGATPVTAACLDGAGIRETTALALLALTAEGPSTISKACSVARGYENLANTLCRMGANIRFD
jgi:UDP-N-acetylglucosamine 1-carboxyvinyltransferase